MQGMHEIAGPILFVLETELKSFSDHFKMYPDVSHPLRGVFSYASLEAHVYWIFEKIMNEMVS